MYFKVYKQSLQRLLLFYFIQPHLFYTNIEYGCKKSGIELIKQFKIPIFVDEKPKYLKKKTTFISMGPKRI